jgi:Tol biopolymer transport system component
MKTRTTILATAASLVAASASATSTHAGSEVAPTTITLPDTTTAEVAPTAMSNSWVAFAAGDPDGDIFLVRDGTTAERIAGADGDAIDQVCPTFSPDGTRLAYGQSSRTDDGGYSDVGLVIADLTADGVVSSTTTTALDGMPPAPNSFGRPGARPPCAIWSADGRWLAFGAGSGLVTNDGPVQTYPEPEEIIRQLLAADEVQVVDTETDDVRRLPGVSVTDIKWAPEANELYIVDGGAISVYSVAADQTRQLADASWDVTNLAVSPDGTTLAVQGLKADEEQITVRQAWASVDLRLMDIEGTGDDKRLVDRGVIAMDFEASHGIGPVWSPDGRFIAFQRRCDYTPGNQPCLEQHEAVVVTVDESRATPGEFPPWLDMAQTVIPPPATAPVDGIRQYWYPFAVDWSSDSTTLLYDAWNYASGADWNRALVAVPVDGETQPTILHAPGQLAGYAFPPVPLSSWSHEQR